ncbi:ORF11 [Silurid herpesvirus 1]|nr:ORF11 [Silurid herpesvirus 1]AVP72262.1 ORF11 [Silurid herpesvirus 1]
MEAHSQLLESFGSAPLLGANDPRIACNCCGQPMLAPSRRGGCGHLFCHFCVPPRCTVCGGKDRRMRPAWDLYDIIRSSPVRRLMGMPYAESVPPMTMTLFHTDVLDPEEFALEGFEHADFEQVEFDFGNSVLEELVTALLVLVSCGVVTEDKGTRDILMVENMGGWAGAIPLPGKLIRRLKRVEVATKSTLKGGLLRKFLLLAIARLVRAYHTTLDDPRGLPVRGHGFQTLGDIKRLLGRFLPPGYLAPIPEFPDKLRKVEATIQAYTWRCHWWSLPDVCFYDPTRFF